MATYKLLAGKHIDDAGTHGPGAVVHSDVDLVATFGANKFQLLGGGAENQPAEEDLPPTPDPVANLTDEPKPHAPVHAPPHAPKKPHKK